MTQRTRFLSVVAGLSLCGLLLANAYATQTLYHTIKLPGVDHHGNLNLKYGGNARVKVVFDTKTRNFCATGKATVYNYSCRAQTYYGRIAIGLASLAEQVKIPLRAITITKDEYRVDHGFFHCAYGKALVCGRVTANPRES